MRTMSGSPCLHYNCSNRNCFGYCKTTVCINEHYQQERWGLQSTTNKSESVVIKQPTNADRIRQMSDEELAQLFMDSYGYAPWCDTDSESWCGNDSCKPCCEKWLQSPVEVDNG